jgi:hypothetical protein
VEFLFAQGASLLLQRPDFHIDLFQALERVHGFL